MKIIGVIPARYQSSRFPGKPLAQILGKPMIAYVYERAAQVKAIDELLVATDSDEIFTACGKLGIPVAMTRDTHATGTDRLGEIAEKTDVDFYVNIQGDEPLIEPSVISSIVEYKLAHPEVSVINTMTRVKPDTDINDRSVVKAAAAKTAICYIFQERRSPAPSAGKR